MTMETPAPESENTEEARGFCIHCQARWADMDPNSHMKNTAFLDYAADSRMAFFKSNGFPMARFAQLGMGPMALEDRLEYKREIHLYEPFTVELLLGRMVTDGSRFSLVNLFWKGEGILAARMETRGAWLDQKIRKITAPPEDLWKIMAGLPRWTPPA